MGICAHIFHYMQPALALKPQENIHFVFVFGKQTSAAFKVVRTKNENKSSVYLMLAFQNEQGKVPGHFELEVSSSMDMSSEEHSNGIMEHKIEESNDVSVGQVTEVSCLCHSNYQSLFNNIPCDWVLIVLLWSTAETSNQG